MKTGTIKISEVVLVGNFGQADDQTDYVVGESYRDLMTTALISAYPEHEVIVDIALHRASGCAHEPQIDIDGIDGLDEDDVRAEMSAIGDSIAEEIYE